MPLCTNCKIQLTKKSSYKKGNRLQTYCKSCFNTICKDRWIQRKNQAIEYKGSKCFDCKQSFPRQVYDFHHLNPKEKEFNWTKLRLKSWDKIIKELDKCILLCANCHRIRHID